MLWGLVLMKVAAADAAFPWFVRCIVTLYHTKHFTGNHPSSIVMQIFENFSCHEERNVIHFWLLLQEFSQTC